MLTDLTDLGSFIFSNDEHLQNIDGSIEDIEEGILIFLREEHSKKANSPIDFTFPENSTL